MTIVELLVKSEEVIGVKYKYFYRLVKRELLIDSVYEGKVVIQSYGIEVERHDIVNDNMVNIERNSIENISPSRFKVHNLLKFLFDNTVSPVHLVDIIGEKVDEYVSDYNDKLGVLAEI